MTLTTTTMTMTTMTMTMTMGRNRNRSRSRSRSLNLSRAGAGAGNFKNGRLRQPCLNGEFQATIVWRTRRSVWVRGQGWVGSAEEGCARSEEWRVWVVGCEECGIQQGSSHSWQIRECPVNDDAELINVTNSLVFASQCSVIVGVVAKIYLTWCRGLLCSALKFVALSQSRKPQHLVTCN